MTMRQSISGGRRRTVPVFLPLVFSIAAALFSVLPDAASASESCSMMGGTCRDVCGGSEKAEAGDFEDCRPKQECCVVQVEAQCCILSYDAGMFGPANCRAPEKGACTKGSPSPAPCAKLPMCATVK
jgi:hypothetical protein